MIWDGDIRDSPGDKPSGILTALERNVLALSATGLGIGEVAECLGRPTEPIRRALASAMSRLGSRSKLEAVVTALQTGLIDVPAQSSEWAIHRRTDDAAS
jgi:DNA-binding CsgD family transcriptional regulator